jgi:hypothetical protein
MGERQGCLWQPTFNRSIQVRRKDDRLTGDAGLLLIREGDHRLGLTADLAGRMRDPRDPAKTRYTLTELLRQRIYALAQGCRAQDDLDTLAHDVAMKMAVWDRPGAAVLKERLGSQPTHSRLLDIVGDDKVNREAMRAALATWVLRHQRASGPDRAARSGTLDVDSFPTVICGKQVGGAYNGYYRNLIYHPMVASFASGGDYDSPRLGDGFVHAILRQGNAAAAQGAVRFILTAVEKARPLAQHLDVRIDAAFTVGPVMDPLTDAGVRFLGRLRNNAALDRLAAPYLTRPPGRPPQQGYEYAVDLGPYRCDSWRHAQRLVLVIVDQPDPITGQLNLLPNYFFLIGNWPRQQKSAWQLVEHYRRRGTFEDRLGEFNQAIGPGLSSPGFAANEATLLLALLAFNLTNMLRGEMEKATPQSGWDLQRLTGSVLKAGGRVLEHGRRLIVDLAASAAPLWELLLDRLRRWRLPKRWGEAPTPRARPWVPLPAHAHRSLVLRM